MLPHVNISKEFAAPYEAMIGFDKTAETAADAAGLSKLLVELVKIRVSQLNGCAFCLRMHSRDAVAAGETADRLAVVAAWWEAQYFTPEEQAGYKKAGAEVRVKIRCGDRALGYSLFHGVWEWFYEKVIFYF